MARFPFGIPNSWFMLLYSDELAAGEVKPLHYLGRELVAYREPGGAARVVDAFCPHLGAHLGHGGKRVGDTLQCPFHGWRFAADGRCVHVPYADKIPPRAQLESWPVCERNGAIFVWHHDQDEPPAFEVPVIAQYGDPDFTSSWQRYDWIVKTHPQEIMENAIDWPHFHQVHLMDMPDQRSHKFDEHMFTWNVGTTKRVQTMGGVEDTFYMEAQNWGLGYMFLSYAGMFTTALHTGLTPIDAETTHFRTAIIGRKDGRSEDETVALLRAYMDDQSLAIEQDFAIWQTKKFRPRPLLCDGDGPIGEYRRWARRFYTRDWLEDA